jgi:hypothetical protein
VIHFLLVCILFTICHWDGADNDTLFVPDLKLPEFHKHRPR